MSPRPLLRFASFVTLVLGAPALAFRLLAPETAEAAGPAMLVFLLTPALAGWGLSLGVRPVPQARHPAVVAAIGISLAIVGASTAVSFAGGSWVLGGTLNLSAAATGMVSGLLTSTFEELGWSAGGIRLARGALGPRAGVVGLGVVWACWHLVIATSAPAEVQLGMFGTDGPLGAPRVLAFVAGCVAYRVVLVALRDRADSVWPAVAAHAAGNVLLNAIIGSGWARLDPAASWVTFPGPTGLPFLAFTLAAVVGVRWRWPGAAPTDTSRRS